MLFERVRVAVAELVQQPRRALDVAEQTGDGAARDLRHRALETAYESAWELRSP
jgi:hypothetical protein